MNIPPTKNILTGLSLVGAGAALIVADRYVSIPFLQWIAGALIFAGIVKYLV